MKKAVRVISIFLIAAMVLSFAACKKSGADDGKFWAKVDKVEEPSYQSGTMALADFEKQYRPYTDWRIYEIRTAETTVKPVGSGTAYYVSNSGNNNNDGLSPENPLKDYAGAKMKGLKSGDVIYFERGGIWRGTNEITTDGLTIAAYGEGKAPKFYASPENGSGDGYWKETDVANVYEYKDRFNQDVGAIIFDDKECTYKSTYTTADMTDSKSTKLVNSYKNLKEDLQLYHDVKTYKVYLCSTEGNPSDRFKNIEFNVSKHVFRVTADNVTFDGVCVKYTGAHGISSSTCDGLTVRNCEFGWIGGGRQGGITETTRYGNGVEIWGGAVNFTVENNYFYQNYDAGATFQFSSKVQDVKVDNVKFNNNVFEYCNYSIEYFITIPGDEKITDFEIDGNIFWYAGDGLCAQRDDRSGSNHIKSWGHQNPLANPIKITNNFFALGVRQLCETLDATGVGADYDSNVYVQTEGKRVAVNTGLDDYFKMDSKVESNIKTYLRDKNATIIKISK